MISDIIANWKLNFTNRMSETDTYDADLFLKRKKHLPPKTTLSQYQAFMALVQDFGVSVLDYLTSEQHAAVLRGTIGTEYPGTSDEELVEILQAYIQSCSLIYDEEIEKQLGGVIL